MANPKLKVDVNHNPTKKGIKVQFVFPNILQGDEKDALSQKLQQKLTTSLSTYNLTVSRDNDVPMDNVIGFTIPISDIKTLISNALTGKSNETSTPEEAPTK